MSTSRNQQFVLVNEFINHGDLKLGEGRFVEREWLLDEEPWELNLNTKKNIAWARESILFMTIGTALMKPAWKRSLTLPIISQSTAEL